MAVRAKGHRYGGLLLREAIDGYLFAAPTLIGLILFSLGPFIASLYLSFTDFPGIKPPTWVGLNNYARMFLRDGLFLKSLWVTSYYTFVSVPLSLLSGFLVAVLLNQQVRGIVSYRSIWYMPTLVPAVANAVLWRWLLNKDFGLLNVGLRSLGIVGPGWLIQPQWTVPSLILISLWGMGSAMLVNLAGLQGVPQHLYEAVEIDGGNFWDKFRHVTIPMVSPIIFFNFVMGIIGSFQAFNLVYVLFRVTDSTGSTAGPDNAGLFYVLYLYRNAFQWFKMGYASALAWILLLIIFFFTALTFRSSRSWVYYEGASAR
jgi:multiple sugar transport system permease protein